MVSSSLSYVFFFIEALAPEQGLAGARAGVHHIKQPFAFSSFFARMGEGKLFLEPPLDSFLAFDCLMEKDLFEECQAMLYEGMG